MKRRTWILAVCLAFATALAAAQTISWTFAPPGYKAREIDLGPALGPGEGFTGALAVDPADPDIVYASTGYWQHNSVVRIDLSGPTVTKAASGYFGSIGGLAVPGPNQLVVIDNDDYTTNSIPGETILILTDWNTDGDFDDGGEIEDLIAPILVDAAMGGFSGAHARIAPSGDPSNIPSGSLMFQSADGNSKADLFCVTDPTSNTTASYRPAGSNYFTGFDYNGGFDFDSQGRIFMGAANAFWTGEVIALVNSNLDEDIDSGEWNDVVISSSLYGGISDLAIDGEDDAFVITNPWGGFQIQCFDVPADPLNQKAFLDNFANTDSPWLTSIILTSRTAPFEPDNAPGAVMVVGGYAPGYFNATNLLTLTPNDGSGVRDWNLYSK